MRLSDGTNMTGLQDFALFIAKPFVSTRMHLAHKTPAFMLVMRTLYTNVRGDHYSIAYILHVDHACYAEMTMGSVEVYFASDYRTQHRLCDVILELFNWCRRHRYHRLHETWLAL